MQDEWTKKQRLSLQLLGFFVCSFVGLAASTQQFAARLEYHSALGAPLYRAEAWALYAPWKWAVWASTYAGQLSGAVNDTSLGVTLGLAAGVFSMVAVRKLLAPDEVLDDHGSSRWARRSEVTEWGLDAPASDLEGIVFGRTGDGQYLAHQGKEHALCFAPTRSGKGVGLVLPTLLTWSESVVVLDVKGENYDITAPWRSLYSHCLKFDPTSADTARYNPLFEVRRDHNDVRDVRNIVEILCNPDGQSNAGSDFWTESAKSLLTAATLHVLYAEDDKSLAGVLAFLRDPERDFEATLELMKTTDHKDGQPHPVVAQEAASLQDTAEKTRSGIVKTALQFIDLWDDQILADATRTSDFRLTDLQQSKNPVSLFLAIPPSDLQRLRPLLRLFIVQLTSRLTEELPDGADRNKLLLMLDEFPALGGMDDFETALAYIAGYDIRAFLIAQSLNQLEKAYGQNNAILDNCHLRVAFAQNDERTARRLSDLLGQKTAEKKQTSLSGKRGSFAFENQSESEALFGRQLLTPGEILQLPEDDELVLLAGKPPIRAKKIRYYKDPTFQRLCPEWSEKFEKRAKQLDPRDTPASDVDHPWTGLSAQPAVPAEPPAEDTDQQLKPKNEPDAPAPDDSQTTPDEVSPHEVSPPTDDTGSGENKDSAADSNDFIAPPSDFVSPPGDDFRTTDDNNESTATPNTEDPDPPDESDESDSDDINIKTSGDDTLSGLS